MTKSSHDREPHDGSPMRSTDNRGSFVFGIDVDTIVLKVTQMPGNVPLKFNRSTFDEIILQNT